MRLQLDIFGDEAVRNAHTNRIVARSSDRIGWLRARSRGVTATDAARLSSDEAVHAIAQEKRGFGPLFGGNQFTEHGRMREPHIARWVHDHFSLAPSDALFRSIEHPLHLATPDCLSDDGTVLAEIKTTSKPLNGVPKAYLRQILWQQYVLGAERTLFVWEHHREFVPVGAPNYTWVERDERAIRTLISRANMLLETLEQ